MVVWLKFTYVVLELGYLFHWLETFMKLNSACMIGL